MEFFRALESNSNLYAANALKVHVGRTERIIETPYFLQPFLTIIQQQQLQLLGGSKLAYIQSWHRHFNL